MFLNSINCDHLTRRLHPLMAESTCSSDHMLLPSVLHWLLNIFSLIFSCNVGKENLVHSCLLNVINTQQHTLFDIWLVHWGFGLATNPCCQSLAPMGSRAPGMKMWHGLTEGYDYQLAVKEMATSLLLRRWPRIVRACLYFISKPQITQHQLYLLK